MILTPSLGYARVRFPDTAVIPVREHWSFDSIRAYRLRLVPQVRFTPNRKTTVKSRHVKTGKQKNATKAPVR
jgi:hypothetical protein